MKKGLIKQIIAVILAFSLIVTVFSGVFTVSAECNHNYAYTLTKAPSESVNGSRRGVCTLCGDETTEVVEGMLTNINFAPAAGYNYGTTHDVVGAVLPEQPTVDTALHFVDDLGGIEGNDPANAAHNTQILTEHLKAQVSKYYALKQEHVDHIYFGEGTYYFAPIPVSIWTDGSWIYYGRFTFDGVKGKTKLIVDDVTYKQSTGHYGMFTNPADSYSQLYTTFTDINFTTRTFDTTGKPSESMNFVDGGKKSNGTNLPMNLYQFKAKNCVVSGFNSIFTGCSSITGPYISNSDFVDFGDTFFQGCGLVDMKVTNNVIRGYGYKTSSGYEPSYFQARSSYCSGIISNNKLYNMQFDGDNRSGRVQSTGVVVTPFSNNYCQRVYGVTGVQNVAGNDFADCSKQDMTDFLKTRGTVSSKYTSKTITVITMPSVANRYSSADMTGTYLMSSSCNEALDNAYNFGKIGCDHLFYKTANATDGNDVNIDLSMFPLKYIPHNAYYSGTHLNLNGKSVYARYSKNLSNHGNTSLFDEFGNDVAFVSDQVPEAKTWVNQGYSYETLSDSRIKLKSTSTLATNTTIAKFVIDNADVSVYRRYFIDESKIELISGDYSSLRYLITIADSGGKTLSSFAITPELTGTQGYVAQSGGSTPGQTGTITVSLQTTSPIASANAPLEVIIPPLEIEKYSGMFTGEAPALNIFKTATDYTKVGADYDKLYADIDKVTGFASPETVEKVYFNETYGHLRTVTINGKEIQNDTHALQTALNDIKDTNKELVIEEGSYNLMYNMSLAKQGYKSGSLYFEGGHTYRIRAMGEVRFGIKSDMDSGAMFFQKGEGEVSGYMINIETTKPFESTHKGCVFDRINFKNFMIDDCILGGAYSLFENCTFDSSIYQNGYLAKSTKVFNNSTVTNSSVINNYVHIGWVPAEGYGQKGLMDAGWLFYDSAFLNSTYQDNWCEYIRFNNGGWYEKNGYQASHSLFTGNILDYTVEMRLGYGDIAVGNGHYHCSKWDLLYNDKGVSNMTYEIVNRSVGTYHISSGVTVIGNSFTTTHAASPAIYFEGKTNAPSADGTKAIKNATVFGNKYTYGGSENTVFAVAGEVALDVPSLDIDRENSLYNKLDIKGSTGNYFDYAQVNFVTTPNHTMPGSVVQSGDVMGILGYNESTGAIDTLTPTGTAVGGCGITPDMMEGFTGTAYYNNGNIAIPEFTLKDGDYELKEGIDYHTISTGKTIKTGYILRIDGKGKYYGSFKVKFDIVKAPISLANVKLSFDTAAYDGADKKPTVVFAYYNHADISGHFKVSYPAHTAFGKSYVLLTANSTSSYFTGSKKVEFEVTGGEYEFEKEYDVAPSCTAEGYTSYFCWHCLETVQADFVPALGHNMQVSEKKDPTCTADGYIKTACANGCGKTATETQGMIVHVNRFYEIPATCTTAGEDGRRCIYCGGNQVITGTSEPLGHAKTYEKVVEGNCQTAGEIQHICSDCGEVLSCDKFNIDENAHTWVIKQLTKAPTCTEDGAAVASCSVCGEYSESAVIPATGHTAGDVSENGSEQLRNCTVCGKVCGKEYVYDWDFTDEENGAADAKELEAATSILVNGSENYYHSSMGSYLIPFVSSLTTSAMVFETPSDAVPKTFDVTTKGDPYNNCNSVPGVIFAHDENGIYTYAVYMNASSSVTEVVYYVPYSRTSGEVTGFQTPWLLMPNATNIASVHSEIGGRIIEVSDIYSVYGFKPGAAEAKYATYDYHLSVSGNTVTIYADIHFSFDKVPNADPIKFDLVTEKRTFSLDSIIMDAPLYYNTNYYTKTDVTHAEFKLGFGVYQYTRDNINTAYQQGLGEIKGATVNYTVAIDCKHAKTYKSGAVAPTCIKSGKQADEICADCGAIVVPGEIIMPLGHDKQIVTVEPTCTELGSTTTSCSRCDYNTFVNLPAVGHNLSEYELSSPADCENEGVESAKCYNCGGVVNRYLPALGHSYQNWQITTEPTATTDGIKQATCTVCGKLTTETVLARKYIEYDWDFSDRISGAYNASYSAEKVMLIDTANGNYSKSNYRYYNAETRTLDIKSVSGNTQVAIITPDEGYTPTSFSVSAYTESFWTYNNTPGVIIAQDADYYYYLQVYFLRQVLYYNVRGIKKSAISATNTEGIYGMLASNLSKNKSAVKINGVAVNGAALSTPTNSITKLIGADNLTEYTTSDGATVAYALPLTFDYNIKVADGVPVLDTTLNYVKDGTGETITIELEQLEITPTLFGLAETTELTPIFGYIVNSSGTSFSCYKTENTGICKVNYVNALYTAGEGAHIHEYTAGEAVAETCEESGYTPYTCPCGDNYKLISTLPLGHIGTPVKVEPTCNKKGSITTVCTRCGNEEVETIAAFGHDYVYEQIDATCTERGKKITTCTRCDYSRTINIAALGHKYLTETVDATCTAEGSVTTTCSRCDYSSTEVLAALGHTAGDWIIDKEPSETEEGSAHTVCTVCGEVAETKVLDKVVKIIYGDSDGDGAVTAADAIMVARVISGIANLDEEREPYLDVNGDGKINSVDAILVARYAAKIITSFPVEEQA